MSLEKKTHRFWMISSSWRGRLSAEQVSEAGLKTCGDVMSGLINLGQLVQHFRLSDRIYSLLNAVVEGKRSKKRKPTNNVVHLQLRRMSSSRQGLPDAVVNGYAYELKTAQHKSGQ